MGRDLKVYYFSSKDKYIEYNESDRSERPWGFDEDVSRLDMGKMNYFEGSHQELQKQLMHLAIDANTENEYKTISVIARILADHMCCMELNYIVIMND